MECAGCKQLKLNFWKYRSLSLGNIQKMLTIPTYYINQLGNTLKMLIIPTYYISNIPISAEVKPSPKLNIYHLRYWTQLLDCDFLVYLGKFWKLCSLSVCYGSSMHWPQLRFILPSSAAEERGDWWISYNIILQVCSLYLFHLMMRCSVPIPIMYSAWKCIW